MRRWIIGLTVLVLVTAFAYFRFTNAKTNNPGASDLASQIQSGLGLPTPTPFIEMTIPALRARVYQSNLTDLKQLSQNSAYTSYLTSYNSDGLKVNALLTKPTGKMPEGGWPAIIFVHGYIPPTLYKTTEKYVEYVNALARAGFVVFKIDLRGHGDSEGEAGGAYYSSDYVVDVLNARAVLQDKVDFVHPDKIGFWGHSMAGNITFRSLVVAQNVRAAAIWAGAVYTYEDFAQFTISDNSYRPPATNSASRKKRDELFATYGSFDVGNKFWQQVVPTNYLEGITTALQVHHAVDDSVVEIGYSRNLMNKLEGSSLPHELFEYQSGGHNITGASFSLAMSRTIAFYTKYLKN